MVPLVGIMFSNIVMGVTNYLAYKYEMTQALSSWLVGHFSTVIRGRYELVWLTVPLVILEMCIRDRPVGLQKDAPAEHEVHREVFPAQLLQFGIVGQGGSDPVRG